MPEAKYSPDVAIGISSDEPEFKYDLLRGHKLTDGSWKTDDQLRMEYIQLTDGLINVMTNGVEVIDPETQEKQTRKPDVVVWLDKSARPLAWFTKDLWPTLAVDPKTGEVPKMPEFKFVNIDKKQWVNTIDPEGVGIMDINKVDASVVRSLRSIFISPRDKKEGLTEKIDTTHSDLDNKTILIVDEVYSSGDTLTIAKKFFERAFPTARVAGTHWMRGVVIKEGAFGNKDLPVWYKAKSEMGRGVANRSEQLSGRSSNSTQRLGAWFLSRRFPSDEPDVKGLQLRKELRHLAHYPEVPILPAFSRPNRRELISFFNNGASFESVMQRVREIKSQR